MIPLTECVKGTVYEIHARNFHVGVFDGETGFIGIREKFHSLYLFTEYHHDTGAPYGTVRPERALDVELPEGMELTERFPTICVTCNKRAEFDKPVRQGGKGWYHLDGDESHEVKATSMQNQPLFDFLKPLEAEAVRRWQVEHGITPGPIPFGGNDEPA